MRVDGRTKNGGSQMTLSAEEVDHFLGLLLERQQDDERNDELNDALVETFARLAARRSS